MTRNVGVTVSAASVALLCAAAVPFAAVGGQAPAAPPSAAQILVRVGQVYARCRSYSDTGVVTDRYAGLLGHTTTKPFRTAFVRPDRFRFQFTEAKGLLGRDYAYIVWRNGTDVRTWWDVRPGVERAPSLLLALAGATGVSGSSAHTIPNLLLPDEVGGRCLTDVAQARLLEDALVGASACFRVTGTYADWPITLWIDKGSYLVRRIDLTTEISGGPVDHTTTYEPVLDGEVTEAMLAFAPPTPR